MPNLKTLDDLIEILEQAKAIREQHGNMPLTALRFQDSLYDSFTEELPLSLELKVNEQFSPKGAELYVNH